MAEDQRARPGDPGTGARAGSVRRACGGFSGPVRARPGWRQPCGVSAEPPSNEPTAFAGGDRVKDLAQAVEHAQLQVMLLAKSFRINDTVQYEDNRHKAKQGARSYVEGQQSKRLECPHSKGDSICDPQGKWGVFGADVLRLLWRDTRCVYAPDLLFAA